LIHGATEALINPIVGDPEDEENVADDGKGAKKTEHGISERRKATRAGRAGEIDLLINLSACPAPTVWEERQKGKIRAPPEAVLDVSIRLSGQIEYADNFLENQGFLRLAELMPPAAP
jgi:hypothetical protein